MYKQIIHGIQALRRWAELQQSSVLGAAGVRAFCYPHQLYVVRSVLESTQIRHLLADEVGLGKTLESLMIMNALRIRNGGKLRVSIVVGSEERAKQWRSEIFGRFSHTFCENEYQNTDMSSDRLQPQEDGFRIFVSQDSQDNKKFRDSYMKPEHCDLLILDEIHSFSNAVKEDIFKYSEDYQNVLVLTATPPIEDEEERNQLLKILNSDYADWFNLTKTSPNVNSILMLRSQRQDFPRSLAGHETEIKFIEPLDNDGKRIQKAQQLMKKMIADSLIKKESAILFIRRSTIGGRTLRKRIDNYKKYSQFSKELTELRKLCDLQMGDARFDELTDYLLKFFSTDGSRKIVIAAQDNPTISYLKKRIEFCLPEVGLKPHRKPVEILEFRKETSQRDEKNDSDVDSATNKEEPENIEIKNTNLLGIIEKFRRGTAQILIAHNDAREAFNLQDADALVFFSLAWNPRDMVQWLGRISRLGLRKKKTVEIVVLVYQGLIDKQILDIYLSSHLFNLSLDLKEDKENLNKIRKKVHRLVFSEKETALFASNNDSYINTHIVPREAAFDLEKRVKFAPAVEPVIKRKNQQPQQNQFPQEEALDNWLNLLQEHQFYYRHRYNDVRFKESPTSHWYKFWVMQKDYRCIESNIPEKIGDAYIIRRVDIQSMPRNEVSIFFKPSSVKWELVPNKQLKYGTDGYDEHSVPLQFFNFGSPLHDELVKTFTSVFNSPKLYQFTVPFNTEQFDEDSEVESGKYLIGILTTERKRFEHKSLLDGLPKSENKTQDEMRQSEQRRLETGLQADDRFLDLLFPGSLEIHGYKRIDEKWNEVKPEQLYDFLTHLPNVKNQDIKEIPSNVLNNLTRLAQKATVNRWQQNFQPLLEERIAALRQELQIRKDVLRLKIEEQQRKIDGETNEQTIRLNYEPVKKRLEEKLVIVHKHFEVRQQYLTDSIGAANSPQCVCKAVLHLNVQLINTK